MGDSVLVSQDILVALSQGEASEEAGGPWRQGTVLRDWGGPTGARTERLPGAGSCPLFP